MDIEALLGDQAEYLLEHKATGVPVAMLTTPGPEFVADAFGPSDRSPQVLRNLQSLGAPGRRGGNPHGPLPPN